MRRLPRSRAKTLPEVMKMDKNRRNCVAALFSIAVSVDFISS